MRWPPSIQVLGALAAIAAAAGCIALVNDDPSKLTSSCHFQGDDTVCGRCIASACAAPLEVCCGDFACAKSALALVPDCFGSSSYQCASVLAAAPGLASCIAASCPMCGGDGAAPFPGAAPDAGRTSCTASGDSCFCSVSSAPNGAVCNVVGIKGGGLCCATFGWPQATDSTCSCEPFSCKPTSQGGTCSLGIDSTGTTTWGGAGGGCCSYGTSCDCNPNQTCSASSVTRCDVASVGCASSQVKVESCSF